MQIDARDLLILMECAKFTLSINNQKRTTGFSDETISTVHNKVFNAFQEIKLVIKEEDVRETDSEKE